MTAGKIGLAADVTTGQPDFPGAPAILDGETELGAHLVRVQSVQLAPGEAENQRPGLLQVDRIREAAPGEFDRDLQHRRFEIQISGDFGVPDHQHPAAGVGVLPQQHLPDQFGSQRLVGGVEIDAITPADRIPQAAFGGGQSSSFQHVASRLPDERSRPEVGGLCAACYCPEWSSPG
ncbi:hypothetical protein [Amycolatopsis sp. NPDC004169]|uniref:hypothetical protein n=1 Tax=Amycolatopsis sp. NPDC004169 TaxID=3154453 RepID=UPI0033BC8AEF